MGRKTPQDPNSNQLEAPSISNSEDGEDGPSFEGSGRVAPVNLTRKRMTRMLAGRSFNARPPLTHVYTDPSRSNEPAAARNTLSSSPPALAKDHSSSTSTDSFHSVQSSRSRTTLLSASPRAGDVSIQAESTESSDLRPPITGVSENATTVDDTANVDSNPSVTTDQIDSAEPTPRLTNESKETEDKESGPKASPPSPSEPRRTTSEGKPQKHQRSHASSLSISRPALSPLPSAANLFSAAPKQTTQSRFATVRQLPTSIVQKILGVLLGPPSYLIKLMLKVAAKIAAGEWRGLVLGFGEAGEEIPVQWDYYSDGEYSDLSDSDDYTVANSSSDVGDRSTRTGARRRIRPRRNDGDDSWEVD